ncbi:MAG: hypothetical protein ACI4Q3_00595 [Kiritimatiellia bacterium]
MRTPEEFTSSLEEAETACIAYLAAVLGLKPGTSIFRSVNPGSPDCAVFDIGYPFTGELNTFKAPAYHFRAQLDIVSRDRRWLQAALMAILAATPVNSQHNAASNIRTATNVDTFRVAAESAAVSEITTTEIKTEHGDKSVPTFTATVKFDVVFVAGPHPEVPTI